MALFSKKSVEDSEKKKVKRRKPLEKKKVKYSYRKVNQKVANRLLLVFVLGIVLLSALTIASNAFKAIVPEKKEPVISYQKDSRNLSNRVGLFMKDFLNAYFSLSSEDNNQKLSSFYGPTIDLKNTTTNKDSRLKSATLIEITNDKAIYRVGYSVNVNDEWKDNVGVIVIPYSEKENKFYVSDLPYFVDEGSYVVKNKGDQIRMRSQNEENKYKAEMQYLEAFLKAYTSGDDTQMLPFSRDIKPVLGYVFQTIDYSYFLKEGSKITVVLQVTFVDGLGLTHQENFTIKLREDKTKETYSVEKMIHGITKKMKKEIQ
ncbi:transposase [Streptococcus iniae]|nr:transposase [Streptococcus iniae]